MQLGFSNMTGEAKLTGNRTEIENVLKACKLQAEVEVLTWSEGDDEGKFDTIVGIFREKSAYFDSLISELCNHDWEKDTSKPPRTK